MRAEASGQPDSRASRYVGALVIGVFAVQAAIAGGVSAALGAEGAANTSFTFAGVCAIGALGGAVFAYRSDRRQQS